MKSLGQDCPTRGPLGALVSDATTCNGLHRNESMATAPTANRAVAPATALWNTGMQGLYVRSRPGDQLKTVRRFPP
jgi:hypothetical protein